LSGLKPLFLSKNLGIALSKNQIYSVSMKAVLLAAGNGTRMQPLTFSQPKALIDVCDKPIIYHLVSAFPNKIDELIIVIGYLGDQIREYCKSEFLGRHVTYVEQEKKNGTLDALKCCEHLLNDEPFAVFYVDDLLDKESITKLASHPSSIMVQKSIYPEKYGVVSLREDGTIDNIEEKPTHPKSNLIVTNGCVITKDIFSYTPIMHPNGEYYLTTILDNFARDHKTAVVYAKSWIPLGDPNELNNAQKILREYPNLLY
jgi:bifunctional UDP-N-acetylglucosamine pyrophosphorylase/glucosamine-1-phosphate N-acetyltransferase